MTDDQLLAQLHHAEAREERALDLLTRLLRQLERVQGYSSHSEQADLREARALLAEKR
jgi:hypothetical protein